MLVKCYLCGPGADPDKAKAEVRALNPDALVQAVSARVARNAMLVEMLAAQTLHARAGGYLLARKQEIDFILRIAGTAQISKAIGFAGAKKGEPFLLVVATQGDTLRGASRVQWRKLARRKLSVEELERVEMGALLTAERS